MMPLANIRTINIPIKVLDSTFDFLQKYGRKQLESHAIWVGKKTDTTFDILGTWFPVQINSAISYEVPEEEEFRINVKLNKKKLITIAQIHTHPYSAFHSSVDDEGSELVLIDSLSIVIPNFGFIEKDDLTQWKVYRYTGKSWEYLHEQEVSKICRLI